MQNTQKQETSTDSSQSAEGSSPIKGLTFVEKDYPNFFVEFAEDRGDIVYHFWPPGESLEFRPGFARTLEHGFKQTLPPSTEVHAAYTTRQEAAIQQAHGVGLVLPRRLAHIKDAPARETYYVRVIGGAAHPLSDLFLKDRVFRNIETAIQEGV